MSDSNRKTEKDNGDDRVRLRPHEKVGSSRDGLADRFRRPSDSHDHHKYYEERDDAEKYLYKEDSRSREGHREHRHSAKDEKVKDRASHGSGRSSRRDEDDDRHRKEKEGRRIKDDAYREADGYRARQSTKGENIYEKLEKGGRESSVEAGDRVRKPSHEGKYFHDHGRERSVEAGDRVKRSHDGERESRVDGRETPVDALATNKVKRSFESKESYSLRDVRERSIESLERTKRSHEVKDSHSYKDGRERLEDSERAKRSHEGKDSHSYKDGRERLEDAERVKRFYEGKDSHSYRDSRERSIEAVDRAKRHHEGNDSHCYRDSRELSIEAIDRAKRHHEGKDSHFHRESRERSIEAVDKANRHHEGKDCHSLKDNRERSIDVVDRAGRSHEGKDSHFYRDSNERSIEAVNRGRSSRETKDMNPYDEEMDGRPRKRREREHDSEGRKDKSDKRKKFTEDDTKDDRKHKGEKRKLDAKMEEELTNEQADHRSAKRQVLEEGFRGSSQANDGRKRVGASGNGSTVVNGVVQGLPVVDSKDSLKSLPRSEFPTDIKVSTVSSTNVVENKADNIARSDEVTGKTSTDGIASTASKGGSLSLDALAKAKKALQIQKELSEKLKKLPQLNKSAGSSYVATPSVAPSQTSASTSISVSSAPTMSAAMKAAIIASTSEPATTAAGNIKPVPGMANLMSGYASIPNYEAVKRAQELAAKLGFHQDPEFMPLLNMFPGQLPDQFGTAGQQKPAKAPVLRLDAQGREIDEQGNVIDKPKITNLSTLKVNINKQKKEAFQILRPEFDEDPNSNPHFDPKMGINKTKLLRPKRMTFQFVEEGKWSKEAEILKFKSQFGEAQAKELKIKQAQLAKAKAELDINPNLIEVSERFPMKEEKPKDPIPDVEWWDMVLLPSGSYTDVTEGDLKVKMEKLTIYVEHPQPIEPPAEPLPPPPQPLKLTKKEQKKLRTQRRLAKEKDRQEMIRQGLIEPPKPKVKMSNLMKVLGAEATQDPTKLEMEIRSAAAEREQAHVDRNIARKLTPAERREKKERKLFDDPNTLETIVSVYKITDLSHPQTRFKVDINAQENRLTGCAVMSDSMSVVVVEGGSKSIKRYGKLMLHRINWAAAVVKEEDEEEDDERPINKCQLVWQGSVAKPCFNKFMVQQCRTEAAARKFFADAGVAHYWELAVNFSDDQIS